MLDNNRKKIITLGKKHSENIDLLEAAHFLTECDPHPLYIPHIGALHRWFLIAVPWFGRATNNSRHD